MSKKVREWYVCDYCGIEVNPNRTAYTDNSGINNQCYDMCSTECMLKHLVFLKKWMAENEQKSDIAQWIKNHFWINGCAYNMSGDNAKQIFEREIRSIRKHWNSI